MWRLPKQVLWDAAWCLSARLLDHPDIAEHYGVAVPLQVQRSRRGAFLLAAGGWAFGQLHLIVDDDAIVLDRDHGVLHLLVALEAGGLEVDVVGLPRERRVAHVEQRLELRIEAAALIV